MIRRLGMLILCAGLVLAQDEAPAPEGTVRTTPHPAREPGKSVATVAIRKKAFSFALPADWVLQEILDMKQEIQDAKVELGWTVLLPGSTEPAELLLVRDETLPSPRSAPYYHKESQTWEGETEIRPSPVPRLVVTRPGRDWINAYVFFTIRNNPYYFHLSCADEDFAQAEQDLMAAIPGFVADVAIWPPIPQGYVTQQEGVWIIAKAPSVTASLAPLIAGLKESEKRFRRQHGALPKGDPVVVLVQASASDTKGIEPGANEAAGGFYADVMHRRVLAVPLAKEDLEQQGRLAEAAHGLLYMARYGDTRPLWVWVGECTVARVEAVTGKPLPSLDPCFVDWFSNLKLHTLDELEETRRSDMAAWNVESFLYVAMLRTGKYKKAYGEILAEFGETGDGLAFDRNILRMGQEELRSATNDTVKAFKPEKRKKPK